jgi:hypothetical protein
MSFDPVRGAPDTDLAVNNLHFNELARSCKGKIQAEFVEGCQGEFINLFVSNDLTVNNFTIQNLINLDCELFTCFVVDNRGLQYCDTTYQTVQEAVDAVCASGLARAKICIMPSDYPENVTIPADCATELVLCGAQNANESNVGRSIIFGTLTVNRSVYIDSLRIDSTGLGTPAVIVDPLVGGNTPHLTLQDVDLTSTVNAPLATLEIRNTTGTVPLTIVRADNSRISRIGGVSVHTTGASSFLMTADTNLRGNFVNESTAMTTPLGGNLLVNSSIQGQVVQGSTTFGIRMQDIRLTTAGGAPSLVWTVANTSAAPITMINGFIQCTAVGAGAFVFPTPVTDPLSLIMGGVIDYLGTGYTVAGAVGTSRATI